MRRPQRIFVALTVLSLIAVCLPVWGPATVVAKDPSLHFLYGSGSVTGGRPLNLRVELTAPAPQGGIRVRLSTTNIAVQVPGSVLVPAGKSDLAFTVATSAVETELSVTIRAEFGGVTKSRAVQIKPPALAGLSVQSVMRAGGTAKITVKLTGPAPSSGISVDLTTNRPTLITPQSPVVIYPQKQSVTIIVSVGNVPREAPINVIARLNGERLVVPSIIRNFDAPVSDPNCNRNRAIANSDRIAVQFTDRHGYQNGPALKLHADGNFERHRLTNPGTHDHGNAGTAVDSVRVAIPIGRCGQRFNGDLRCLSVSAAGHTSLREFSFEQRDGRSLSGHIPRDMGGSVGRMSAG